MSLVLVRVSEEAYAAIKSNPDHLEVILDAEEFAPELGILDDDLYELNYLDAARYCKERGLDDDEAEDDGVLKDLGVDGAIDYEATYGPAFSISPAAAAKACAASVLLGHDEDLKAWVAEAAKHASYVVGVVI
jgi:hypothetical protein